MTYVTHRFWHQIRNAPVCATMVYFCDTIANYLWDNYYWFDYINIETHLYIKLDLRKDLSYPIVSSYPRVYIPIFYRHNICGVYLADRFCMINSVVNMSATFRWSSWSNFQCSHVVSCCIDRYNVNSYLGIELHLIQDLLREIWLIVDVLLFFKLFILYSLKHATIECILWFVQLVSFQYVFIWF